ncbi:flagellar hook-associated protein FlgK [Bacillus atrophaeus]|uniref:flagellar hook-associated protein FlgK n=1 Tax=Bacillus atrophaeus TaxID=1452 RepID=UPI00227F6AE0|nr:flagellar hook-associated protein FlgK [Bacillus atrophaeus]MCY8485442.1 flagellar hook-associated protein FlgK [Bacillus atrophaeus]
MSSTFMGLETARRALSAQQAALSTTANNVANANTDGYTRQRVSLEATSSFPAVSKNAEKVAGQIGTGVEAKSVERIRDSFLDYQYRLQNNNSGYYDTRANALGQMEGVMNETDDSGLSSVLNSFWKSLQELTNNSNEDSARSVVSQKGQDVAGAFNHISESLTNVQSNLKTELDSSVLDVNSLLSQLNSLNQQIAQVEPSGNLPNGLYDQRDVLLDKLSSLVDIKVSYNKSGGNALASSEGTVSIEILDKNKQSLGTVLDGKDYKATELKVNYDEETGLAKSVSIGDSEIQADSFSSNGSLLGFIQSYGYVTADGEEKGIYPEMLSDLDNMALEFAKAFNEVHRNGLTASGEQGGDFFDFSSGEANPVKGAAAKIKVTDSIKNSKGQNIAFSLSGEPNDNSNATKLASVLTGNITISGKKTTVLDYYASLIGELGIKTQEANRLAANTETQLNAADLNRQQMSAVSLDEEMTNMIQFQHAYNAAARMVTLQDEMLDKVINGMGAGGR